MRASWLAAAGLGCLCWLGVADPSRCAQDWQALAEQWLGAAFPEPDTRWEVRILSTPDVQARRKPSASERIVGLAGQYGRPKKVMRLLVAAAGSDLPVAEIVASAERWRRVAVANRLLGRKECLRPEDWHWEERRVDSLQRDTVRRSEDLAGKRVRKVLTAAEIITAHALEPIPDVRSGQRLRLFVRGDRVMVSLEAEALEEGCIGDCLRLKNPDSGKVVIARIAQPGRAEINLAEGGEAR